MPGHTRARSPQRLAQILRAALLLMTVSAGAAPPEWQGRLSSDLVSIYQQAASGQKPPVANPLAPTARYDSSGRVQVDVHFDCAAAAPRQALVDAGLRVNAVVKVPPLCVVQGWIAPASLARIASAASVVRVEIPKYALHRPRAAAPAGPAKQGTRGSALAPQAGGSSIDGNAITLMHADQYLSDTGVSGTGITVGVMSDNVTSLATIQARGELPAVSVLPSSPGGSLNTNAGDEGTMMLEEVHAVAPGAGLAFCSPETSTGYVGCLSQLASAGATILVDDLAIPGEDLMSSNGEFEQAVQSVLSQSPKVLLFTVTENYNGSYWEGSYSPVAISTLGAGTSTLTCPTNNQTDSYVNGFGGAGAETLTVAASGTYPVTFQWADPFGQNASNFDLYWVDTTAGTSGCFGAAGSTNTELNPSIALTAGDTYAVFVATPDQSLQGKFLKFWVGGDGATALSPSTSGSIISPQAFVPGVMTIGAVNASDGIGDTIEPYSGLGPITLIFPSAQSLQAPLLVGLDGIYVDSSGTTFPAGLFYGTSAASPNAAAVAALIRSAFPTLTPAQLTTALQSGATQLGSAVPDMTFGYGRVDAVGALGAVPMPAVGSLPATTVTGGTSSTPASVTLSGTGNLHLSVQSSNPTLIPAALVAAGTAGITISPSSCGSPTSACTISVTPTIGQVGTASITLTATDGANRKSSASGTVTVIKPAPPAVSVTSGGSQTIVEGGALTPVAFSIAGTGPLTVSAASSNAAILPSVSVTSGCGTSTRTCTATLSAASGQAGSSVVTISVKDSYGQTGSATASLTVNAPSHGGGLIDPRLLVFLAAVVCLRAHARGVSRRSGAVRVAERG